MLGPQFSSLADSTAKISQLQAQLRQCEEASLKAKKDAADEAKKLKDSCGELRSLEDRQAFCFFQQEVDVKSAKQT